MNNETKTFVEACEQRCAKATSGPIDVHRYDNDGGRISYQLQQSTGDAIVLCAFDDDDNLNARNDAAFYSHARVALPEALRIIREQDAENERLRSAVAALAETWGKDSDECDIDPERAGDEEQYLTMSTRSEVLGDCHDSLQSILGANQ